MLDVREHRLRPYAFEGNFGLEREALRVTGEGRMALTPHPFPPDHPRIVRDFCENQTEINTRVWPTAEEAVAELKEIDAAILAAAKTQVGKPNATYSICDYTYEFGYYRTENVPGDYRLNKGSPCIDKGTKASAAKNLYGSKDLAGKKRVKGKSVDIGCYEF